MRRYSSIVGVALVLASCSGVTVYDIAFIGQSPNPAHIRYMDADGTLSDPLFLPDGMSVYPSGHNALNWSRDGERLVFASLVSGNLDIYSIRSDGTDLQRITNDPERDESPEYRPDGTQIVYLSSRNDIHSRDIYVRELSSGIDTRLTATSNYYISPTWHPDGERVFYGVGGSASVSLHAMDIASGTTTQLATLPYTAQGFRASPDGTKIAYYTAGGITNVHVINSDGTGEQNLTNNTSFADDFQFPAWYQANQLLYAKYGLGEGVYRMNQNGSAKNLVGAYSGAPWSPVYRFQRIVRCASFDALNPGDAYPVSASVPSEIAFIVGAFTFSTGETYTSGELRVDNRGYAAGSGNDINIRNVTLAPLHVFPATGIRFRFGELGGTNNLTVNGTFSQVADLRELDGTVVSGVSVAVSAVQSGNNWYGEARFSGTITDFSIGGQELWIDDYCFDS